MTVRPAEEDDIEAMVALIEDQRTIYEDYEPVFWRKAADSDEKSAEYFAALIDNPGPVILVAEEVEEVVGFLVILETPAPPVYEPGGMTATIDDFCVAEPGMWDSVGQELLDAAAAVGRERNWRQLVVIAGYRDEAKMDWLGTTGLSLASTWWTAPL